MVTFSFTHIQIIPCINFDDDNQPNSIKYGQFVFFSIGVEVQNFIYDLIMWPETFKTKNKYEIILNILKYH